VETEALAAGLRFSLHATVHGLFSLWWGLRELGQQPRMNPPTSVWAAKPTLGVKSSMA
jgi:hypothetical protein